MLVYLIPKPVKNKLLLLSFPSRRNASSERLSDLSEVTQLIIARVRCETRSAGHHHLEAFSLK